MRSLRDVRNFVSRVDYRKKSFLPGRVIMRKLPETDSIRYLGISAPFIGKSHIPRSLLLILDQPPGELPFLRSASPRIVFRVSRCNRSVLDWEELLR